MKKTAILLLTASLLAMSCASYFTYQQAQQESEQGRYSQAVLLLAGSLQQNPDHRKTIVLLKEVFPLAVTDNLNCVDNNRANPAEFSWSQTADCYLLLHRINDAVTTLPPLYDKKAKANVTFEVTYFHRELETARVKAAEEQYQAGIALTGGSDPQQLKKAHTFFQKALEYVPGYKDAAQRAASSREAATARIIVLPTVDNSNYFHKVNTSLIAYNTLLTELSRQAQQKTYTKILDRSNIEEIMQEQQLAVSEMIDNSTALRIGSLLGASHLVVSQILQVNYTPPSLVLSREERTVLVPAENPVKDQLKDKAELLKAKTDGKGSATVLLFTQSTSFTISASYKLTNLETSQLITGNVLEATATDKAVWAEYEGDRNALTKQDLDLLEAGKELALPEDLLTEAAAQIGKTMATEISAYLD